MAAEAKDDQVIGFGEALRALRERHGLTQFDLSRSSGISQSTVSALETGKQRPWPSTRRALASAFNMTLETFDEQTMRGPRAQESAAEADGERAETAETVLRLIEQVHDLEDRLRRSDQQLAMIRRFLDQVPLMIWMTDAEGRVTSVTGWAARRLSEWSGAVGNTLERHLKEHFGVDDAAFSLLEAERQARAGATAGFRCELGGDVLEGVIEPVRDGRRKVIGTIAAAVRREAGHDRAVDHAE